jgi:hypothetical protein
MQVLPRNIILAALALTGACAEQPNVAKADAFNDLAEQYVRLVLSMGTHDADYVDAYFGPAEWRREAESNPAELAVISDTARTLADEAASIDTSSSERLVKLRQAFLVSHLRSLSAFAKFRDGERKSFDEESLALFGFVAPTYPKEYYDEAIADLEESLPGEGPLHERIDAVRQSVRIPDQHIETAVRAGIEECRRRTLDQITLPKHESFEMELVTDKPWSAYNWYQGSAHSLIQVDVSKPAYIGSPIRLGCHEGYPGHHTFNALLEAEYVTKRGWVEFVVLPLFSPFAVIAEGSGNYAETIAFPETGRKEFFREHILPLTGISADSMNEYEALRSKLDAIRYASIEAARNYLDGKWDKKTTTEWLIKYAMANPNTIDSTFSFWDRYRSYVINYVLGEDLVRQYVERENPDGDVKDNWVAFAKLISLPPSPLLLKGE